MAVSTTESKIVFNATGGTTYDFPYDFLADEANLVVYYEDTLGETTLLVLTTDYTVNESTGVVTTVVTYTDGKIIIVRDVTATQTFDVTTGDGFQPDDLEHALDKTVMLTQENERKVDGAFRLSDSDTSGASTIVPTPEGGEYMRWSDDGLSLESASPSDIATAIQASNFVADNYVDGVDFTSGVTTELVLSGQPGAKENTQVYFDGVYIDKGEYSLASATITFSAAIVATEVEVMTITAAAAQTIADLSVTTAKIATGAVTNPKLATDAVSTAKILNSAVTIGKIDFLDTDGTLAANSDSLVPSQGAVKTYVDKNAGYYTEIADVTQTGVVVDQDLSSFTLEANELAAGEGIIVRGAFNLDAGSGLNDTILKFNFGGAAITVWQESGVYSNEKVYVELMLFNIDGAVNSQRISGFTHQKGGLGDEFYPIYAEASIDTTANVTVKFTASIENAGDGVEQKMMVVQRLSV